MSEGGKIKPLTSEGKLENPRSNAGVALLRGLAVTDRESANVDTFC
jgi:hypothetical protein